MAAQPRKAACKFKTRKQDMKTIRLLYPDFLSGGLDEYYFGAQLLCLIVPPNDD